MTKDIHATTILCVRRGNRVAMGGDGQVTLGSIAMKHTANKLRVVKTHGREILIGFAGSPADALTMYEGFEARLEKCSGKALKSAVELTREFRSSSSQRKLEAMLLVADINDTLVITGNFDLLQPEDEVTAIGSGGSYAQAAALALHANTDLSPLKIVQVAMKIASNLCIYTNNNLVTREL